MKSSIVVLYDFSRDNFLPLFCTLQHKKPANITNHETKGWGLCIKRIVRNLLAWGVSFLLLLFLLFFFFKQKRGKCVFLFLSFTPFFSFILPIHEIFLSTFFYCLRIHALFQDTIMGIFCKVIIIGIFTYDFIEKLSYEQFRSLFVFSLPVIFDRIYSNRCIRINRRRVEDLQIHF